MGKRIKKIGAVSIGLILLMTIVATEISANKKLKEPELRVNPVGNSVAIDWAVEMADEDVLYQTGFEVGDELPRLTYNASGNREFGGQTFDTNEKYNGNRSLKIENSYLNGNFQDIDLNGGVTYRPFSSAIFTERKYMENGANLSVTFRAKTTGEGSIQLVGSGGRADYGSPIPVTFEEDVKIGAREVKVSDVKYFKPYVDKGEKYYLANMKGSYTDFIFITGINEEKSTITVNKQFMGEFKKGDNLLMHGHRNPVQFTPQQVNRDDGWKLINANTWVYNYVDYNTLNRGFEMWVRTTTEDIVNIDEMKIGYATRTELYRDNKKVYDGYLSELKDKEAVDTTSPEKVKDVKFELEGNKVFAYVEEVEDIGTPYKYKVRAYPRSGGVSESEEKEITVKSGLKGYSYVIDNNPDTVPSGEVNNKDGKIEVPINSNEKYYVHIQSVDNEGNKSGVSHFEFQDNTPPKVEVGVDVTEETDGEVVISIDATDRETAVQRIQLPSKEWHNGNKVDYTVKENGMYLFRVEDIAGNIAEENVKVSNIRKPGQGSQNGTGAVSNKAMLKVLGGELSLEVGEVKPIGVVKLESRSIKETEFTTPITVRDLRGTGQGWRLTVRGGQLTEQVPLGLMEDGYEGYKVPVGSVVLGSIKNVLTSEGNPQDGINYVKEPLVVDDGDTNLVMEIEEGNSSGEYGIVYGEDAISVIVDSTTIRVNKYSDRTEYKSVIEWNLVSAP